ncbi:MAG: glycosyltransferase family 2 protein [Clostridia bacterium]|jgi:glycosyltransferase involved in cell wall biosynthesis
MLNSIKVSIIVPVYNAEHTIIKCCDSIATQTYENLEIWLVDDGSTDGSFRLCKQLQMNDIRFNVIHKENGGVSSARNAGIKNATGDYVTFIDSDDYISPDYIEKMVCENQDADLIISGIQVVDDNSFLEKYALNNCCTETSDFLKGYKTTFDPICINGPCCKLYKKRLIDDHQLSFPEDISLGEDTVFVLKYLQVAKTVKSIDYIGYYYYRARTDSLFNKFRVDRYDTTKKVYSYLIDGFSHIGVDDDTMQKAYSSYYGALFNCVIGYFANSSKPAKDNRSKAALQFKQDDTIKKYLANAKKNKKLKICKALVNCRLNWPLFLFFCAYGMKVKKGITE